MAATDLVRLRLITLSTLLPSCHAQQMLALRELKSALRVEVTVRVKV